MDIGIGLKGNLGSLTVLKIGSSFFEKRAVGVESATDSDFELFIQAALAKYLDVFGLMFLIHFLNIGG